MKILFSGRRDAVAGLASVLFPAEFAVTLWIIRWVVVKENRKAEIIRKVLGGKNPKD
jgi:hypothetical protein